MRGAGVISAPPGPCDTVGLVRSGVVSALVAALLLAAIFVCPCPAMAAERHGCCADETTSIGPSSCCASAAGSTTATPRLAAPAPSLVSLALAATVTAAPATSPSTNVPAVPASPPPPVSPPRVLRI